MRKLLVLILLLVPVLSLNLTVECDSNCYTYIPVNGYGYLNYSVNGSLLEDVYTSARYINVTGTDINTLMVFDLSDYGCANPSDLFLDQSPIEAAFFENLLIGRQNLSATNKTLKMFCGGSNFLREQPNWYEPVEINSVLSQSNLTLIDNKFILTGLTLEASQEFLDNVGEIEKTYSNVSFAQEKSTNLNISVYSDSLTLQDYIELPYSNYVYLDFGNLTNDNNQFYVVSHGNSTWGNITILDESLSTNVTLGFNLTKGVAITDYDNDTTDEIIGCVNDNSNYNLTTFEFSGTWTNSSLGIFCGSFGSFDPLKYPGVNGSIVTYNSTSLVLIVFNQTTQIYTQAMTNIKDIASIDLDGDSYDELLILTNNKEIKAYNITGLLSTQQIDYYGNHNAQFIDANSKILIYNNSINVYSGNYLTNNGELKYTKTNVLAPVKLSFNFTIGGNGGNATLNTTLEGPSNEPYWYFNKTYTQGTYSVELYPLTNGTLTLNFTLTGADSNSDPWIRIDSLLAHNVSLDYVNFSSYENYTGSSIPINTTILSDSSFTLVGANFTDSYYLKGIVGFFSFGNHSIQLDAQEYSINPSTPSFEISKSSYWVNSTGGVQPSQSEANFSAIAGFSTKLHLVSQGVNISTYGTVNDYCSYGKYFIYTYGNATFMKWVGQVSEVGNITGNFSQCWLGSDRIYLVNSTGGVDIYNYSLVRVDGFANSSFIVQDVVAQNSIYGWNGTHTSKLGLDSKFNISGLQSTKIYGQINTYHNANETTITDKPGFDLALDKLWDVFSSGVHFVINNFIRFVSVPLKYITGFSNQVSYFFDNGTIETLTLNISAPNIGVLNFSTNVTYDAAENWISFDSAEVYLINISVDGYYRNETDTLVNFSMICENSTYSKRMNFIKESNHTFTLVNDSYSGKYTCEIIPVWEVNLPKTFASKSFTAYSDSNAPIINNATSTIYISEEQAFNMTVNVTEDSEVKLFRAYANQGSVSTSIIDSNIIGGFQIYNLSVSYNPIPTSFPLNESFNISAEDYTGKTSSNFTTQNFTVYNNIIPQITIEDKSPGNDIQDFSSVPLNLSIQVTSTDDANIDVINITVFKSGVLEGYSDVTNVNNDTYILWFNKSLTSHLNNYQVTVYTKDITDNFNTKTFDIIRYGINSVTLDGKWYSSANQIEYYWTNQLTSLNINDIDTGSGINTSSTFDVTMNAPDRAVDEWWVFANQSTTTGLKSIKMKYNGAQPNDVTQNLYSSLYLFGINTTDRPDTIILDAQRNVRSAEKMCLMICSDYDLSGNTCNSVSWTEKSCASADDDENIFTVAGGDPLINNIDNQGVAFRIDAVAITGSNSDTSSTTDQTTQIVTTTAENAVITITAPTKKTVAVDSCVDVEYTIKNTGSIAGSISGITVSGINSDEITYTILTDTNYPYNLGVDKTLKTILSFCPLKPDTFNPSVCAKVGSSNKCVTVKITGEGEEKKTTKPLEMEVSVETFEDEYIVFVNSTQGPLEDATVTITYSDGTNDTFLTNVFGKVNFKPKSNDFSVTVDYGDDTITKEIEQIIEQVGFTVWRVLISFLIVGALVAFGVVLDEKMI